MVLVLLMAQLAAVTAQQAVIHDASGSLINETPNNTFIIDADALDKDCARKFECKEQNGQYYFNCYYDFKDSTCRCFLGVQSECRRDLSSFSEDKITSGAVMGNQSGSGNIVVYLKNPLVQGSILIAFLIFVVVLYFMRAGTSDSVNAAVRYHRLAEHYHEKGEEKMAEHYYRLSEKYRELSEEKQNVVEKD